MRNALVALGIVLTAATSACSAGVSSVALLQPATTEQVAQTNFVIGEFRTAVVGEPIVRVKDYVVKRQTLPAVKASQNGTAQLRGVIIGDPPPIPLDSGVEYPIVGERTVEGQRVRLAQISAEQFAQVYDDGTPRHKLMGRTGMGIWVEIAPVAEFQPPTIKFSPVVKTDETAIAAGENYEIIFTGRDASSIRFQYREHTSSDMARAAFSQDLTYPVESSSIRFRGLTIEIQKVGSDDITYRVVSRAPRSSN